MGKVNIYWLLISCFWLSLSKFIAAVRLHYFLRVKAIEIDSFTNIRLYWAGLFYNLFLPGGIGGDGYKMYWFYKQFETPVKDSFWAIFLDRVNGLTALFFLTMLGAYLLPFPFPYKNFILISILLLCYPVYAIVKYYFFNPFFPYIFRSSLYSFSIQLSQLIGVYCILLGLGANTNTLTYLIIFLISSVISALPISIGGIGVREFVFAYGADTLGVAQDVSVATSLLFYITSLLVSFPGIYFAIFPEKIMPSSTIPSSNPP